MWKGRENLAEWGSQEGWKTTSFIFKTHLKDTYKGQNLGKGKGFGSVVNLYREEHDIQSVS